MMAFTPSDRVKVTDQSSQFRNLLGTVKRVVSGTVDDVYVRIDGHERAGEVLFKEDELGTSTLVSQITY
jgi:hypothetical protein